jgi:hypothetical protein
MTLAIVGLVLTGQIAGFREAEGSPAEAAVVNPAKDADFNGDGYGRSDDCRAVAVRGNAGAGGARRLRVRRWAADDGEHVP